MNKKNGFTLIELMAVIVILSIVLILVTKNVIGAKKDSEEKTKYIAAKEIVEIAKAYMISKNIKEDCINVEKMVDDGYLEKDVTNPLNGKNRSKSNELTNQQVCIYPNNPAQTDSAVHEHKYNFDGYYYKLQ